MTSAPTRANARLASVLHVVCGLFALSVTPFLAVAPQGRPGLLMALGGLSAVFGVAIWFLPWQRWPADSTLFLVPFALAMVSAHGWLIGADGYRFGALFMVVFAWIGNTQRRWCSVAFSPLLIVAYGIPAALGPQHQDLALGGAVYVIPICVLLGESVAWMSERNRRAQESEHLSAEFLRAAFDNASVGSVVVGLDGLIVQANRVLDQMLGYATGELTGVRFITLVHPDDQKHVIDYGRMMQRAPRTGAHAERRLLQRDGHSIWVDMSASVTHDTAGDPTFFVAQIQDVTERRAYESNLTYQALHDDLTALPNRVLLMDRMQLSLQRAGDDPGLVAMLYLDLDNFKYVNDSHGHAAGDALLKDIAQRLTATVGKRDTLVRLGGDEFVVFCDRVAQTSDAVELADRIHAALADGFEIAGGRFVANVSIGIAVTDAADASADLLLRDADTALYEAKRRGRSRSELFSNELRDRTTTRVQTETDLRDALARNELQLWYQPITDLTTRQVVGAEALLRWDRGSDGIVLPGDFIDIAEETGLIVPIGEWVVHQACHAAARWMRSGAALSIAVNLSSRQLSSPGLVDTVREALADSGLPPGQLWLEVTESVLIDDADAALTVLQELKDCGVHLALDDFGTGYSSMSYLRRYPFDSLKIDRTFVSDLADHVPDTALVTAIIDMAEALGLETVAEGVERQNQLDVVSELGCTQAQGYLLARPMPEQQFTAHCSQPAAARAQHDPAAPVGRVLA
ncbi:MAG: diguanylate cyclase/phosphodiesterase with sensor(s) [Acidimicrobiales bacterium]|nr:diguanylate cyclase/phosphodiesterase with sensor(s) [Acidimicrobiales bacterium]